MLLSILIVSYNTSDLTIQTLESVWRAVRFSSKLIGKTEVIVIDNQSKDDSVEKIKKFFSKMEKEKSNQVFSQLIQNKTNAGFSAANNLGIKASSGEYVFLLNSDTVLAEDALEKLVTVFEEHPIENGTSSLASHHGELDRLGILAAQLQNPDGSTQPQGGSLPSLWTLANHMLFLDDLPLIGKLLPSTQHTGLRAQTESSVDLHQQGWVGGTAMMIRREVLDEVGVLDSSIFMYGEDIEFCWRAQAHQWDVAICESAHCVHFGSASSSSETAIKGEFKGYLYLWSKHQPMWQQPIMRMILKTGAFLRAFLFGTILKQKKRAMVYTSILSELF